jgi:cytoskeletal protein RodZ
MTQHTQHTTDQRQAETPIFRRKDSGISTAIAIGINQYQFFQPLRYAEADARAVHQCFTQQAVNNKQNSWLFSDTSAPIAGESTYPNRSHLLHWLNYLCQQRHQQFDRIWFFFSGYGATSDRRDYLMPMDGDPYRIGATGIPVSALLGALKAIAGNRVLVILDMNRAPSIGSGQLVGIDTMKVARQLGVPTLLSCKPNQFSRETSALEHGFFTKALLEAWSQDSNISLENLFGYIRDRMRSLTHHHNVPPQEPILEPSFDDRAAPWGQMATNGKNPQKGEQRSAEMVAGVSGVSGTPENIPTEGQRSQGNHRRWHLREFLSRYFFVAGIAAIALLLGMLLGYALRKEPAAVSQEGNNVEPQPATTATEPSTEEQNSTTTKQSSSSESPPTEVESQTTGESTPPSASEAPTTTPDSSNASSNSMPTSVPTLESIAAVQASQFSRAIASVRELPEDHPFAEHAQSAITRWGRVIWEVAQARAQLEDYQGAIAAAKLVPHDGKQMQQQVQAVLPQWEAKYDIASAQKLPRNGQASSYSRAINKLKAISSQDPYYEKAQQLRQRWNAKIWQIARSRAEKQQYQSAIQAAILVPEDASNYETVKKAIASWREKL